MKSKLLFVILFFGGGLLIFENTAYPDDFEKKVICELSSDFIQLSNKDIVTRSSKEIDPNPILTYESQYNFVLNKVYDNPDDLKHLKWVVKTNKSSYGVGEPIGIKIFLCNTSDKEIVIRDAYLPRFFILSSIQIQECEAVVNGKLIKPVRSDVFMTTQGYWIMNSARISEGGSSFITYERITLQSGQMHEMKMSFNCLNTFYDLTSGSNYELIFYQRNFSGDNQISEYPKPCRIKFHIGGFAHIPIEWPEISLNVSEGFSAN